MKIETGEPGWKDEIDESSMWFVARTPDAVLRLVCEGPGHLGGDLAALTDHAVEVLGGKSEVAFEFDGDRGELVVLAWGSSLTDMLADRRFRIVDVQELRC